VTGFQQSVRRLRAARVAAVVLVVVNAASLVLDLATVPVMAFLPATLIVVLLLAISLETHLIGKARARERSLAALAVRREAVAGDLRRVMPGTMAGFEVGTARLTAVLGQCAHKNAEPVDLLTGERVAWICPDCPAELPARWRP
jgi:hypothetical protein